MKNKNAPLLDQSSEAGKSKGNNDLLPILAKGTPKGNQTMTQTNSQVARRCSLGQSSNVQRTESSSVEPCAPIATATEVEIDTIRAYEQHVSQLRTHLEYRSDANPYTQWRDLHLSAVKYHDTITACIHAWYLSIDAFSSERLKKYYSAVFQFRARHICETIHQWDSDLAERMSRLLNIPSPTPQPQPQPQSETHHAAPQTGKMKMPEVQPQTPELRKAREACFAAVNAAGLSTDSQTMLGATFKYFSGRTSHDWFMSTRKAWTVEQWNMVRDAVNGGAWTAGPNGEWRRSFAGKVAA